MSEWDAAKERARKEYRLIEKEIKGYSYASAKSAETTDTALRKAVAANIGMCRDHVFPMIEAAYMEKDFGSAGALEEVMQWLDVFMLELGLMMEWKDHAAMKQYATLIKADWTLLSDSGKLADVLERLNKETLSGKGRSVVKRCAQVKGFVSDLMFVYKKRRHSLGG